MKTLGKKSLARITKNQAGFTLIELLVVVGIIVALAAIIVPAVAKFVTKGEEGGAAGELDTVQVAMDAVMADAMTSKVMPNDSSTNPAGDGVSNFSAGGFGELDPDGGLFYLAEQMRHFETDYQYCWDAKGNVKQLWYDDSNNVVNHDDPATTAADAFDQPIEAPPAGAVAGCP